MMCILNVQLYLTLEKERESVIKEAIEQIKQQSEEEINEEELAEMISEADHIHNKAIFDSVNQAMNLCRPYNTQGEPMPWSPAPRKNVYLQIDESLESVHRCLDKALDHVKGHVMRWADTRAGAMNHYKPIESVEKVLKGQDRQNMGIDHIINQEIVQEDQTEWQGNNENFETQVKLELADMLTDQLIMETIGILNQM